MDEVRIKNITVSMDDKGSGRSTFISWGLSLPERGVTVDEAHQYTADIAKEVHNHVLATQLAKGALTPDEYKGLKRVFQKRQAVALNAALGKEIVGIDESGKPIAELVESPDV